jgi:hypothetical protein
LFSLQLYIGVQLFIFGFQLQLFIFGFIVFGLRLLFIGLTMAEKLPDQLFVTFKKELVREFRMNFM